MPECGRSTFSNDEADSTNWRRESSGLNRLSAKKEPQAQPNVAAMNPGQSNLTGPGLTGKGQILGRLV